MDCRCPSQAWIQGQRVGIPPEDVREGKNGSRQGHGVSRDPLRIPRIGVTLPKSTNDLVGDGLGDDPGESQLRKVLEIHLEEGTNRRLDLVP
jgi:hypothetical protein